MSEAVPQQEHGALSDVYSERKFDSKASAITFYTSVKDRLLHIAQWTDLCSAPAAKFTLIDKFGEEKNSIATVGDFINIDIPGPGNKAGGGYDWVIIEEIGETGTENHEWQSCYIRVRPASNPKNASDETTHFFKNEATSTFIVKRIGTAVTAQVHGRNELPNTDAHKLIDKVRNMLVALGSSLGFSAIQWKVLTKGLINGK